MFEATIHAFTIIGYLFCLIILFCLCCLVCFLTIVAWDLRKRSQRSKYAKHQSAGETTDKDPHNASTFLANLDEIEARQKRSDELAALRDAANRGEYPLKPEWEDFDKNYNKGASPEDVTMIYPFNTIGKGVEDVIDSRFTNRGETSR